MKRLTSYCKLFRIKLGRWLSGNAGDWAEAEAAATGIKPEQEKGVGLDYDPDADMAKEESEAIPPFKKFWDDFKVGKASIRSVDVMLAKFGESGKIIAHKTIKISGVKESRAKELTEAVKSTSLTEAAAKCIEDYFSQDDYGSGGTFDQNNYTEYVPLLGGPFFRQMYLTDMLAAQQKSFEAYNHNPIAHRLVDLVRQYAFARGYKVQSKDKKATDIWTAFEKKFNIRKKVMGPWPTDYLITGEFFLDKEKITSIDSSTIWDIITDPEDIDNVYYYYQSFPTAFQQFTGMDVKGVPGSKDTKSIEYIIRQLPFDRVFHLKGDGMSAEKRGRPMMYPVLSLLKRFKDILNAEVVKLWVQSSYVFDVEVNGSQADVSAIAGSDDVKKVPAVGTSYFHNQAVKRTVLSPSGAGASSQGSIFSLIIAIIAACWGISKEAFNMSGTGGGSRATALVGAEPFTKVIEKIQGEFTGLLQELAAIAFKLEGKEYNGELEFIFPSAVKDSTTEQIQNIAVGEQQKYISHKQASLMYAAEMDITQYDYDAVIQAIKDEQEQAVELGLNQPMPPSFGSDIGGSEIHGQGKVDLEKDMNNL